MRYLQALLYLVAATLAPASASPEEQARATAVLYQALEQRVTGGAAGDVVAYLEKVDPDWAAAARRHLDTGRPKKVVQRLSARKQQYVRASGEAAWFRAHARAKLLVS